MSKMFFFFLSSRRRHTRCALVTGVRRVLFRSADPLRAALSEYNSGSRTRGLTNGYVGRVYAAAKGTGADPASSEKPRAPYGAAAPDEFGPQRVARLLLDAFGGRITDMVRPVDAGRSEEHTSELQSLMRISYAVFCLKKKKGIEKIKHLHYSNKSAYEQ